jgi:hypothetical protein
MPKKYGIINCIGDIAMNIDAGLDAVISAFIRLPELSSIRYRADQDLIEMEIILKDDIDYKKQQLFCRKTIAAIELFHKLKGTKKFELRMQFDNHGNISILSLYRDASSIIEEEIDLYIRLARLEFSNVLLRESDIAALQNQSINDLKNRLLNKLNNGKDIEINVFAYRDRGKMFVFGK